MTATQFSVWTAGETILHAAAAATGAAKGVYFGCPLI